MWLDEVPSAEGDEQSKEIVVSYYGGVKVEDKIRKKIIDAGHVLSVESAAALLVRTPLQ